VSRQRSGCRAGYPDDTLLGFEHKKDARRMLSELNDRIGKFGLRLHGGKTRLIEFGRYAAERRAKRGERRPETFDFLGFTHCSSRTEDLNHHIVPLGTSFC
jgi:hypothetical protein